MLEKVKVSREVAEALDTLSRDEWSNRFNLIGHCRSFSGNGVRIGTTFIDDLNALNNLDPLEYAKCLIIGYERV